MLLEIELTKEINMFCAESAAATVAVYLKRHYEMMYYDMYGFDFQYEKAFQSGDIGNNLEQSYTDIHFMENLEKYHGIKVSAIPFKNSSGIDTLRAELHKSMPVALGINVKYCDWRADKGGALLLLIGENEKGFLCYDIHEGKVPPKLLEFKQVNKCYDRKDDAIYFKFEAISDERSDVTLDLFIDYMKEQIYPRRDEILLKMKKLAECIREKLDLYKEIKGVKDFFHTPIFLNLSNILKARKQTADMLKYIYSFTGDPRAMQYADVLEQLGVDWRFQWSVLGKLACQKHKTKDLKYIEKIAKVAEEIEGIAEREYEFITGVYENKTLRTKQLITCVNNGYLISPESRLTRIELDDYYNNRAFSYKGGKQEEADISGQREYFCLEKNQEFIGGNVCGRKIEIPLKHGKYDNIVCGGQKIGFGGVRCKQLILITCAVWQDVCSPLKILLEDQRELEILAKILDWYNAFQDKSEIWRGNIIDVNRKPSKRSIYAYVYDIGDAVIDSILLPDDDALHIFGIYVTD